MTVSACGDSTLAQQSCLRRRTITVSGLRGKATDPRSAEVCRNPYTSKRTQQPVGVRHPRAQMFRKFVQKFMLQKHDVNFRTVQRASARRARETAPFTKVRFVRKLVLFPTAKIHHVQIRYTLSRRSMSCHVRTPDDTGLSYLQCVLCHCHRVTHHTHATHRQRIVAIPLSRWTDPCHLRICRPPSSRQVPYA